VAPPAPRFPGVEIHPSACVDPPCQIGAGTRIWHFCHVMQGARIGRECSLGQNVMVGPNVVIGDRVKIQNNVSIYEGVELEDLVFCGPSLVFTNVLNPRSEISRRHEYRATRVRRGATLGANATIVCGHEVGRYALVGAGSVVTDDVPAHALVVGVPARRIGWVCRCGVTLARAGGAAEFRCPECDNLYRESDGALATLREVQE
jgi:UDP-2-acetamido-3-amino-2,3-dideoxy-glucuronate N-acetyltransferase